VFLIILGAVLAYQAGTFWPKTTNGLSWLGHSGMSLDALLITPAIFIMAGYIQPNTTNKPLIFAAVLISLMFAVGMHLIFAHTNPPFPNPKWNSTHATFPWTITPSGWCHTLYMALCSTTLILFYIAGKIPAVPLWTATELISTTVLIATVQTSLFFDTKANWGIIALKALVIPALLNAMALYNTLRS